MDNTVTNTTDKYNISEWFNTPNEDICIFSDYEGTTSTQQIKNFDSIFEDGSNKKCIYLGDLFDNANFKDKTLEDEGKSICIKDDNYCVLKMLKSFVDNPDKCKYVVGNRDINKIKLLPLLQNNDNDNDKWWTNGSTYQEIVINLITNFYTTNDSKTFFKINDMKNFAPFWKWTKEGWKNCKNTNWISNLVDNTPTKLYNKIENNLYDRFNKIFGQDCSKGTMSADYTIRGIPNELLGGNIDAEINTISNILKKKHNNIDFENLNFEKEIRSAIVFTLFMRMLDNNLYNKNINRDKSITKLGNLDGYLYEYLNKASPALYAIKEANLYLFAHGGITNNFFESTQNAFSLLKTINWNDVINLNINLKKPEENKPEENNLEENNKNLNKINTFNNQYFECLSKVFNNYNKNITTNITTNITSNKINEDILDEDILILLSLSATVENNDNIKSSGYSSNLSPIQPKLPINAELTKNIKKYTKIYNICGHASSGIGGYGYKENKNKEKSTVFINTDTSGSLFKENICNVKIQKKYNDNYLNLYFNNNKNLVLQGKIFLNVEEKKFDWELTRFTHDPKSDKIYEINYDETLFEIDKAIYEEDVKKITNAETKVDLKKVDLKKVDLKNIVFNGIAFNDFYSTSTNNKKYRIEKTYRIYSCFSGDNKKHFWCIDNKKDVMKNNNKNKPLVKGLIHKFNKQNTSYGGYKKNKSKRKHFCKNKNCKKCNHKFSISKYKFINNKKTKKYKNKYTKKN